MSLLFVADPLEAFKTYKDTTFAMMREAARRGHKLIACTPADLMWQRGARVTALAAREFVLTGREGGVLVGLERLQRVGHEEQAHGRQLSGKALGHALRWLRPLGQVAAGDLGQRWWLGESRTGCPDAIRAPSGGRVRSRTVRGTVRA